MTGLLIPGVVSSGVVSSGVVSSGVVYSGVVSSGVVSSGIVIKGVVSSGVVSSGANPIIKKGIPSTAEGVQLAKSIDNSSTATRVRVSDFFIFFSFLSASKTLKEIIFLIR